MKQCKCKEDSSLCFIPGGDKEPICFPYLSLVRGGHVL